MRGRKRHVKKWAKRSAVALGAGLRLSLGDRVARCAYRMSRAGAIAVKMAVSFPSDWVVKHSVDIYRAPGPRRALVAFDYIAGEA